MGASDRQLAKAGLIGRGKAGEIRSIAQSHDWLNPHNPLPDDSVLAHDAMQDPTLADAILDRLIHNAYKLELKGESLRKKKSWLDRKTATVAE